MILMQEVMLRRLKKDVMSQLPPKRRQVVRLPHVKSLWEKLKEANPGGICWPCSCLADNLSPHLLQQR